MAAGLNSGPAELENQQKSPARAGLYLPLLTVAARKLV
jgi:hypothetical protein